MLKAACWCGISTKRKRAIGTSRSSPRSARSRVAAPAAAAASVAVAAAVKSCLSFSTSAFLAPSRPPSRSPPVMPTCMHGIARARSGLVQAPCQLNLDPVSASATREQSIRALSRTPDTVGA
eukprot:scaffold12317_cov36-Phaeocystis_antarctica.AAC.1